MTRPGSTPDDTPAVVCLHGLRRTPADWDGVRDGLCAEWDVRTPLLPPSPEAALAVADASIAPGDIVVGHSMGAVLAIRLAVQRPRPPAALVLTSSFFAPARNGRTLRATMLDYARHRAALVRELYRRPAGGGRSPRSGSALGLLVREAVRSQRGDAVRADVGTPVLVVHARDDHHVPVDFAVAAARRHSTWSLRVLDHGGHHIHVDRPELWLESVLPWLIRTARAQQ